MKPVFLTSPWYFFWLVLFLVTCLVDNGMIFYLRRRGIPTDRWLTIINEKWRLATIFTVKGFLAGALLLILWTGRIRSYAIGDFAMIYAASVAYSLFRYRKQWKSVVDSSREDPNKEGVSNKSNMPPP